MAQLNSTNVIGNLSVTGQLATAGDSMFMGGKIIQGSPSADSTIASMNRFQTDLFVQGDGSAPNSPKVAGFYLGKSTSDENRHMDIVSGGDYSYIDFNKASNANDFTARLITNVSTGLTEYNWASGATNKKFQINGALGVSSGLTISGAATLNSTLTVSGATTLNSTLTVSSTATLNGDLNVKGTATLGDTTGDVHKVNGNITMNGTVYLANGTTYKLDSAGDANLKTLQLDSAVKFQYNSTDKCVDVIFG